MLTVDRTNSPNSYTGSYQLPSGLDPLLTKLTVVFYSQAGQGGTAVGSATANVTITNGIPVLDTIVVDGTIKSVAVVPATLAVGAPASQLAFTALDVANNTVAVSTGSGKWTLNSGGAVLGLTQDGMGTPKSAGTAKVIVAVDGITSPEGTITVQNFSGQAVWEDITPAGLRTFATVTAVTPNTMAGWTSDQDNSGKKINFAGFTMTPAITFVTSLDVIYGTDGSTVVGAKFLGKHPTFDEVHAILVSPSTVKDVHPLITEFTSYAAGISGDLQVGYGGVLTHFASGGFIGPDHALAWHGSAGSVIDLHPDQFPPPATINDSVVITQATCVSDTLIGGRYNQGNWQACAWTSPSKFSFIDLTVPGTLYSEVLAVDAGRMVGYAGHRPVLWRGPSLAQMVYLDSDDGTSSNWATHITDNYIVGNFNFIWNATTLAKATFAFPPLPNGISALGIGGIRKTGAGLDIVENAYVSGVGTPKIYVLHVPTNLLP